MQKTNEIMVLLNEAPACTMPEYNLLQRLSELIDDLIVNDFNALVQLLYRMDVPESEVKKSLLEQPDQDAALLLAGLLLKRQQEKAVLRKSGTANNSNIPDEERW